MGAHLTPFLMLLLAASLADAEPPLPTVPTKPLRPLTTRQVEAMRIIQEMHDTTGTVPTRQELTDEMGLAGKGNAQQLIDALVGAGYLARDHLRHRGLTILARVPMPPDLDDLVNARWHLSPHLRPAPVMET